jgi:bis(5'-nucleosyl)-tetraphosphatase (symmetrical)
MATWAIGDIHGCWQTFQRLLERIEWTTTRDELWLVGDLVNRGPSSLEVLRWASAHRDQVRAVLGNHDLHLLARADGLADAKKGDTLDRILEAPDRDELLDWLRSLSMMVKFGPFVLVHAGLAPEWNIELAEGYAEVISTDMGGADRKTLLTAITANRKRSWHVDLGREEQLAAAAVTMSRIRMVGPDGRAELGFTGPPAEAPVGWRPWFSSAAVLRQGYAVIFGHWATLGSFHAHDLWCLDSGCVYGGELTALRLDDGEIRRQPLVDIVPETPR